MISLVTYPCLTKYLRPSFSFLLYVNYLLILSPFSTLIRNQKYCVGTLFFSFFYVLKTIMHVSLFRLLTVCEMIFRGTIIDICLVCIWLKLKCCCFDVYSFNICMVKFLYYILSKKHSYTCLNHVRFIWIFWYVWLDFYFDNLYLSNQL